MLKIKSTAYQFCKMENIMSKNKISINLNKKIQNSQKDDELIIEKATNVDSELSPQASPDTNISNHADDRPVIHEDKEGINHTMNTPVNTVPPKSSGTSFAILIALAAAGIGGYSYYQNMQLREQLDSQSKKATDTHSEIQSLTTTIDALKKAQLSAAQAPVTGNEVDLNTIKTSLESEIARVDSKHTQAIEQQLTPILNENNVITKNIDKLNQSVTEISTNFSNKINTLNSDLSEVSAQLTQTTNAANISQQNALKAIESMNILETQVMQKTMKQEMAYKDIDELTQKLKASNDVHALDLAEVHYLLRVAQHKLNFEKDVVSTISALKTAQQRLQTVNEPRFAEPLLQINTALSTLSDVKLPDRKAIAHTLMLISGKMLDAPLLMNQEVKKLRNNFLESQQPEDASTQSVISKIYNKVKPLGRIQREKIEAPALMAPENAFFLNQNLQLQLVAAQNALFTQMPETFLENIKLARSWIATYYDASNPNVAMAKAELDELLTLNYTDVNGPEFPKLDSIIVAFEAAMILRTGGE